MCVCVCYLFFTLVDFLFLLGGKELSHLFIPTQDPLVHDNELSRGDVKSVVNTATQPLTLT